MANYPIMTPEEAASNLDLYEAVHDAINDLNIVRESDVVIHVNVLNGEAELKGVVLSRIMRRAVLQAAASVPRIKRVIDNLMTDPDIEVVIGQALAQEKSLWAADNEISVMSYRGNVTLSGKVPTGDAMQKATEIAAKIPGVVNVINRLNVS